MSAVAPAPSSKSSRPRNARNKQAPPPVIATDGGDLSALSPTNTQQPATPAQGNSSVCSSSSPQNTNDADALLQSIASKQSALLQPTVTLTMYIPTASVGAVIGRRGQNIAALQKLASQHSSKNQPVRVSVIGSAQQAADASCLSGSGATNNTNGGANTPVNNNNNGGATGDTTACSSSSSSQQQPLTYSKLDFSNPDWTPVVIRADCRAALIAAKKLEETVGGEQCVDEVVLDIPLSRNKHAAIVGKRGMVLANISADTNVRILVPNKDLRHDIVQLEGSLSNVKQCLDRVLQVAMKAKNDYYSQTITCQQVPSQAKLRSLSRKTDVTIKKKKMEGDLWQLTVSGTLSEQVQTAIASLQKNEDSTTATTTATAPTTTTTTTTATSTAASTSTTSANGGGKGETTTTEGSSERGTAAASPAAAKPRGGGGVARRGFGRGNNRNGNNNDKPKRGGGSKKGGGGVDGA